MALSALIKSLRGRLVPVLEAYFSNFVYFSRYLRHRMVLVLGTSILVGVLDGFGLAMFIPLLEFSASSAPSMTAEELGNLGFLVEGLQRLGVDFTMELVLVVMVGFFLVKGVMEFLNLFVITLSRQFFFRTLSERGILSLARYRFQEFAAADAGHIQNSMSGEISRVTVAFKQYMVVLKSLMLISVYAVLAFLSNPQFAVLVLVGGVLSNVAFQALYAKTKSLSSDYTSQSHGFHGLLIQQVTHFKYLKATGRIMGYASRLVRQIRMLERTNRKVGELNALMKGLREPLLVLVVAGVILIEVKVFGGGLALILLSILFFYRALTHVLIMQTHWNEFLSYTGSIGNTIAFHKALEGGEETPVAEPSRPEGTRIELEGVSFGYEPGRPILDGVTLEIPPNQTLAVVGESGSGKTTLLNILTGMLQPQEGAVRVGGVDMDHLDMDAFRKRIGYITQEPVIFDDTVFNNVTFWEERTPETFARFELALERASVLDFVRELPGGADARLGNNGINLSGGQRQRISIARELYREVDYLIMDEATSALDSDTERTIKTNIDALKGHYTIVIIAHRLSTIRNADRVVILNRGRVQDIGTYESLVEGSEVFKRMVDLQEV